MPERLSALDTCLIPGDFGVPDASQPALQLSERPLGNLLQIAGWEDFETLCRPVVKKYGFSKFDDYRAVQSSDAGECYAIAPDKILVHLKDDKVIDSLRSSVDQGKLVVTDLTHARCVISIAGQACEALMARLAGVDFSLPAFPVGSFVQTGIHHVGVLIKRDEPDGFEIFVPYTWAASIWDYLCTCALGFGYRVAGDHK